MKSLHPIAFAVSRLPIANSRVSLAFILMEILQAIDVWLLLFPGLDG